MLIYLIIKSEHDFVNTWNDIEGDAYLDKGLAEYNCALLEETNPDKCVHYFVDTITVNTGIL